MPHLVRDWMSSPVVVVDPDTTVSYAMTLMRRRNIHSVVVDIGEKNKQYGIITTTDIRDKIVAVNRNAAETHVRDIMSGPVVTGKAEKRWKHIEFVRLDPTQALLVLVGEDGSLENRLLPLPAGLPASALFEASNYLNARLRGRSLTDVRAEIETHRQQMETEVDQLTARLIDSGLASASDSPGGATQLIVRGQANLLDDVRAAEDIERIRLLFADLETKKDVIDLLSRAETADGVRIFIGSENKLFSLSGSSLIAAPFRDSQQRIVGVLGVIGPTRLNYARIVPMVDYTARVVGRMLGERD